MLDVDIRKNALVAMMTARGELIGLGRMAMSTEKVLAAKSGVAVETKRILMDRGHYPRMWHYSTDLDSDEEPEFVF